LLRAKQRSIGVNHTLVLSLKRLASRSKAARPAQIGSALRFSKPHLASAYSQLTRLVGLCQIAKPSTDTSHPLTSRKDAGQVVLASLDVSLTNALDALPGL
jgi:hypothetical protein